MDRNIKRGACVALALTAALALYACAPAEEVSTEIGTSEEHFRFACYSTPFYENVGDPPYGLHPDQNTDENWKNIADCYFNYAMPTNDVTHAQTISTLKAAEKAGIKVLVMDYLADGLPQTIRRSENKTYGEVAATIERNESAMIERYEEYATYSSFAGLQIFDEPSATYFEAIAAGQDWWLEHFPQYEYYCNLLPSYASHGQLFGAEEGGTYAEYVDRFVQTNNPAAISYDFYPFVRSGVSAEIRTSYLSDLEVFAEASKKYEIPFYCYQLCAGHLTTTKPETYREYAWQAYTAMAYGCKGLQTFKYWAYLVPESNPLNLGYGLVDPDGALMPLYYAVQETNREIIAMEKYFMNFSWQGTHPVGISGGGAFSVLRNPLKALTGCKAEASEDAIIGEFKDAAGNRAFMVVNYSSPYRNLGCTVTLTFDRAKKALVLKKGRTLLVELDNGKLTLELGSGEGDFVIPVL